MAAGRTGSLESLRRLNRLRVIDALRDEGLISRAEIARRTGLSRSTVSSLVSDLQADGLVVERSEPAAGARRPGRPPADPALASTRRPASPSASTSTTTTCASRSPTSRSRILAEASCQLDTDHDAHEGLDAAAELVERAARRGGRRRRRA